MWWKASLEALNSSSVCYVTFLVYIPYNHVVESEFINLKFEQRLLRNIFSLHFPILVLININGVAGRVWEILKSGVRLRGSILAVIPRKKGKSGGYLMTSSRTCKTRQLQKTPRKERWEQCDHCMLHGWVQYRKVVGRTWMLRVSSGFLTYSQEEEISQV